MHTVIINGTGGVGKDTWITEFDKITGLKAHRVSIVDMVKKAAQILGWKNAKTDENRKALSELKDLSDKYWGSNIDYVMANYEDYSMHNGYEVCNWFFIIAREPKDITKLVELIPDAKTVLITRDGVESHGNHADDEVSDYKYDLVFENNKSIKESSMDFAVALYELFGEDPSNISTPLELINTNITGVEFYDYAEYGLGYFTVEKCYIYYMYSRHTEHPDGSHWFRKGKIQVRTRWGKTFELPFCPWWRLVDKDGKMFQDYYDEQPW